MSRSRVVNRAIKIAIGHLFHGNVPSKVFDFILTTRLFLHVYAILFDLFCATEALTSILAMVDFFR